MLTDEVIAKVATRAKELAAHSWEFGTAAEALLELENPELSVFHKHAFSHGKIASEVDNRCQSLKYVAQHIQIDGSKTLCADDTGVADPASLGVSAILLGQRHPEYLAAAQRQVRYLLEEAPRYGETAISHRKDVEEVWADFIYMIPPFLAFYAVAVDDINVMEAAVAQCEAYYKELAQKDESGPDHGLWHHIAGPKHDDPGYWSTGNGWVAAGLTRVLATLMSWESTRGSGFEGVVSLKRMIRDLIDGVVTTDLHRHEEELLPNYLYAKDDEPWFGDVAGTALLTSAVYRMMRLDYEHFRRYRQWADRKSKAVFSCVDLESGIARPTVDSLKHAQREPLMTGNPEAQSFVVLMWAAMRDFYFTQEEC
ncbi:uncharacterized protein N0V89_003012 [Didymosphaeria variabile]|uniref:Six-hairpin glycosidase n=1 Tax=Didymosphaeria variabile TaxID=1932322 RepID=A0A9W8XTQ2_9PLEO|nr:uncharacterized protein N0V89_003012 [Didymosphaeria variabile]KAJ4358429.1 hypothetical protein N0V89_003012 [Didymosphaeria variabile]